MFERFSDRSRAVLVHAQEEARLLGHGFIGTEHLLLGLLCEDAELAAGVLASLGVSLDAAREAVSRTVGKTDFSPQGSLPFTPRAKKVLELSLREALEVGDGEIGSAHILLGLFREGEGVGVQVLTELGADPASVRVEALRALAEHPAEPHTQATPAAWPGRPPGEWTSHSPLVATPPGWRGLVARATGVVVGPGLGGVVPAVGVIGTRGLLWALAVRGATRRSWRVSASAGLPLAVVDAAAWAGVRRNRRPRVTHPLLTSTSRLASTPHRRLGAPSGSAVCSFYGRRGGDGDQVVAGPGVLICGECLELCREIIAEQEGD